MGRVKQPSDPGLSGILEIIAQKVGRDVHDQSSADLLDHVLPCLNHAVNLNTLVSWG